MEVIVEGGRAGRAARPFEVVERKGLGHPDTICDALAEALSVALSRFYLDRFGVILHHNVDKALLCAGAARPAFGGGEVLAPIEILFAGRATREYRGVTVPVEDIAAQCARRWFAANLHALDAARHVRVRCLIRPGSADLVELFARHRGGAVPLANDTSCGIGFAPLSALESATLAVERRLNGGAVKARHPEIGEDIKIMSLRHGARARLTLACAFVDRHVADAGDYRAKTDAAAALAAEAARAAGCAEVAVAVNTGDDPATGSLYLTVTGTSAEAGDDGEVGRGNRVNGLITPFRPMTLEAAAGKNPVNHVGKLYNIAAQRIAASLVADTDGVRDAQVCLVSRIGRPVSDPQIAHLRLGLAAGCRLADVRPPAEAVLGDHLSRIPALWKEMIDDTPGLF